MTYTKKQVLPALHNSGKVNNPDLPDIETKNYTSTVLKYANLALQFPQLETDAKTVVAAINELYNSGSDVIPNPPGEATATLTKLGINEVIYALAGIKVVAVTLTVVGWNSSTLQQTVTVSGITATNNILVSPVSDDTGNYDNYTAAGIRAINQSTNSITFKCNTIPSTAVDVCIGYWE